MANAHNAFGFRPVKRLDGADWSGAVLDCYISANYAAALFIGDPVMVTLTTANVDPTGQRLSLTIATASSTNKILGFITSFSPLQTDLTKIYNPASTERYAKVVLPDGMVFEVRDDGSAVMGVAAVGMEANAVAGSGSTVTGLSGWGLIASTAAVAQATFQCHVIGSPAVPDNDPTLAYAKWYVTVNLPALFPGIALTASRS